VTQRRTSASYLRSVGDRVVILCYVRAMATKNRPTSEIESLVEQTARELLAAKPALKTAPLIERNAAIALAFRAEEGSAARLMAAFRGIPSLESLRKGWIQQRGGAGMPAQGQALPRLFVSRAIEGHSVKSMLKEARAFAKSPMCVTQSYTALAGVTVAAVVSLKEDTDLIPWSDVPESTHKALFEEEVSPSIPAVRAIPNSAVRTSSAKAQVLFSSHKEAKASTKDSDGSSTIPTAQIDDLLRCITTMSVQRVAAIGSWVQFDNEIADIIGPSFYLHRPGVFDHGLWQLSRKPVVLTGRDIVRLFHLFGELKPADKDVMRIALDRLSRALRAGDGVDNAIDLGIALEAMLLHGIGKNDRGELRSRLSIRGATFLGGEKPERLRILKLLKDAYDLRSMAVHSGVLKKEKKGSPPKGATRKWDKHLCADSTEVDRTRFITRLGRRVRYWPAVKLVSSLRGPAMALWAIVAFSPHLGSLCPSEPRPGTTGIGLTLNIWARYGCCRP
jgi:Apea-like HEPN